MKDAKLLHYSHCVSDLARSKAFYTDVLGFEVMAEFEFDDPDTSAVMGLPEGCKFTGVFMKRDGQRIEIIAFTDPPPGEAPRRRGSNEIGHSHFSFYVKNLDAALDYLRSKGVPVDERSRRVLPSGIACCVVRDPDGFPIEIVEQEALSLLPYETE